MKTLLSIIALLWVSASFATPLSDAKTEAQKSLDAINAVQECPPVVVCQVCPVCPGPTPTTLINYSLWKSNLPIDKNGTFSGTAIEINPLTATYSNAPYYVHTNDGGILFSAPVEGAKTSSNTNYARSELRELDGKGNDAAWTVAQGATLSATLAVNEIPTATGGTKLSRIVIGQFHGPNDELMRIYAEHVNTNTFRVYFHDDKSGPSQKEIEYPLLDGAGKPEIVPLNAKFSYKAVVNSQTLTVTSSFNGNNYSASEPISSFWPGLSLYAKAGDYLGVGKIGSAAGSQGTGRGTDTFYSINVSHP